MRYNQNKKIKNSLTRGFTIAESLVAIGILSLSVVATFTAVQGGLRSSSISKERVAAFYMAQEAVEYIKNLRDENDLQSIQSSGSGGSAVDWLHGTAEDSSDPCYFGKTCVLDVLPQTFTACSGGSGSCDNLRQDPSSGFYGYDPLWRETNFKREISFTQNNPNEVILNVQISWSSHGETNSFTASELLFNRQ